MIELNILNYFVVILGGFGIVWGFRHYSGRPTTKIGEFEYAAFSAFWGIPIPFLFFYFIAPHTSAAMLNLIDTVPMMVTLILLPIGVGVGYVAGTIYKHLHR